MPDGSAERGKGSFAVVKYPNVHVRLVGQEGNAFFILGTVAKALRRGGVSDEEVKQFQKEAMSGDYEELLAACLRWVDVY